MMETIRSVSEYISDGDWIESKDQSSCGIRLVQTGNIGNTKYLEKENRSKYISEETFERLHCSEIFAGDILISRLPDPVGRACIVPENMGKAITAVDCTIVRVNKEKCLPKYLLYYTDSPRYRHQIGKYLLGATRIRISRKNLETIQVPVPNINEQQCIVKNLSKVDTLIDKVRDQLLLMDELVKSRFIELFGEYPAVQTLANVATITGGLTKNSKRDKLELRKPYLRVANVSFAAIDTTEMLDIGLTREEYAKTLLKNGDLLFVEGNGSPDQIGRVAIWNGEIEDCVHQNHLIKARFDLKRMNPVFAMYYFISERGRSQIKKKAVSTSGLYTLSVSKIADFEIPNPPLELQQQFAAFVAQIDKSKLAAQQGLQELEVLKKSLMQKYFG